MKSIVVVRHVPEEALGKLEQVLHSAGAKLRVVDVFAEDWPRVQQAGLPLDDASGLIVMGGPMSANQEDQFPFLATELAWLREALAIRLPVLGICLGSQLLAKAAGASVYQHHQKEIGWYGIELTAAALDDPLFAGLSSTQTVFQWHGDTFALPEGALLLAKGATCRHQIIRCGPCAYGVQFHPEMTEPMVHDWFQVPSLAEDWEALAPIDPREITARASTEIARSSSFVEALFARFAALCRQQEAALGR